MRSIICLAFVLALAACGGGSGGGGGAGGSGAPVCVTDVHCGGDTPHCASGTCVACTDDAQCAGELLCVNARCVEASAFVVHGLADGRLDFGDVGLGLSVERELEIENTGGTALSIVHAQVGGGFSVAAASPLEVPVGARVQVAVRFAPEHEGAAAHELVFSAGRASVPVQLAGMGVRPGVSCDTRTLDFGEVAVGTTVQVALSCMNTTPVALPLSLEVEGEGFAVPSSAGPVEIDSRRTLDVLIAFRPSDLGPATGTLHIVGPDGVAAADVELIGIGTWRLAVDGALDFGFAAPGTPVRRTLRLRNLTDGPLVVDAAVEMGSAFAIDGSSRLTVPAEDRTTDALEGVLDLPLVFTPAPGPAAALLHLVADGTTIDVQLRGFGGGPELRCGQPLLDLGPVAIGIPATGTVFCTNSGTGSGAEAENLRIGGLRTDGAGWSAALRADHPAAGVAPGGSFAIDVTFDPAAAGPTPGTLFVASNAIGSTGEFPIALAAEALDLPPCNARLLPTALDFGAVEPDAFVSLEAVLVNDGPHACVVRDVAWQPGNRAFGHEEIGTGVTVLAAGERMSIGVVFAPDAAGTFSSTLRLGVSDPQAPERLLPVSGVARNGCLQWVDHTWHDYGSIVPGCTSRSMPVGFRNACSTSVSITGVTATDPWGSFAVGTLPELPFTLAPGARFDVPVRFGAVAQGTTFGAVHVATSESPAPYLAIVQGEGSMLALRTDFGFGAAGRSAFELVAVPTDSDGDAGVTAADLTVRVQGQVVQPGSVWRWNGAANAVEFQPGHVPGEGEQVAVTYVAACN